MRALYKKENGFASVTALWILAILTLIASGIAFKMRLELDANRQYLLKIKAKQLALAGVRRAYAVIQKDMIRAVDHLEESWSNNSPLFEKTALGEGYFEVSHQHIDEEGDTLIWYGLLDEQSKLNLNSASLPMLERLPEMPVEVAAAIIDWRDADDIPLSRGAESAYYLSLPVPYECKNADFESLEELSLLRGMTGEIMRAILPYVTVYGNGKININCAGKPVMICLGFDNDLIDKIFYFRREGVSDPDYADNRRFFKSISSITADLEHLTPAQVNVIGNAAGKIDVKSGYFRICSNGILTDSDIFSTIDLVVSRPDSGGLEVEYWHER